MVTEAEHRDAARIATEAGRALLELRQRLAVDGSNAKEVKDDGDRQSHDLILAALRAAYPGDPVLSEEGKDDAARLSSARVWIVDPLDGTREFGEMGRGDWAVHVALIVDERPVCGAVALPVSGVTYSTGAPPLLPSRPDRVPRVVVSRSRPPTLALQVAERLGAELVELGSAGAKTMAVVRGEVDIYLHAGGQYEWDSAAPIAVATATGLHVSRLDGSPLRYNQPNPWLPDQLVCHPDFAARVLAMIAELST